MIVFTMQNYFNYEVLMLSFYEIIVPNVTSPVPQIPSPKHSRIRDIYIYILYIYISYCTV